jgi:catechol 2,3-dioxygenase-like lactoylglutathione lyase family enzyme
MTISAAQPKAGSSPRITWSAEQIAEYERTLAKRPHFSRLNHISLSVLDLRQSQSFYIEVLGGRLVYDSPHFIEVLVAGTIIGMSDLRGRPPVATAEYPHLGLEIESDQFEPMKAWLTACGVKTHTIWTRLNIEGLMYFKDPSGNLLECFCPQFAGVKDPNKPPEALDVSTLDYVWDGTTAPK